MNINSGTITIVPTDANVALSSSAAAGVFLVRYSNTGSQTAQFIEDLNGYQVRQISGSNATNVLSFDTRGLNKTLSIYAKNSGAGTQTLQVEGSVDNTNYLALESPIGAADPQVKLYTETTTGAAIALSPLSFRYLRITVGAGGVGNTTTVTVAMK